MLSRLGRDFFERSTLTVARELLGKVFVYENTERLSGKIVEVEADMDIDLSTPQHIAKLEQEVLGRTQQNEKA